MDRPDVHLHPTMRGNQDLRWSAAAVVIIAAFLAIGRHVHPGDWFVLPAFAGLAIAFVALENRFSTITVDDGMVTIRHVLELRSSSFALADLRVITRFSYWIVFSDSSGKTLGRARPYWSNQQLTKLASDLSVRLDQRSKWGLLNR